MFFYKKKKKIESHDGFWIILPNRKLDVLLDYVFWPNPVPVTSPAALPWIPLSAPGLGLARPMARPSRVAPAQPGTCADRPHPAKVNLAASDVDPNRGPGGRG